MAQLVLMALGDGPAGPAAAFTTVPAHYTPQSVGEILARMAVSLAKRHTCTGLVCTTDPERIRAVVKAGMPVSPEVADALNLPLPVGAQAAAWVKTGESAASPAGPVDLSPARWAH